MPNLRTFNPTSLSRRAAILHAARERRKGLQDPAYGLFGVHVFAAGAAVTASSSFPAAVRDRPATFAVSVVRTDAASSGLVFELGSSSVGIAAALDGPDLIVAAGAAAASDDGVTLTLTDALPGLDQTYRIVVAVVPGSGRLAVWIDGRLVDFATSVGEVLTGWTDADDGAVGATPEGTVLDRIAAPLQVAPSDFDLVSPLRVFVGQTPRQTP